MYPIEKYQFKVYEHINEDNTKSSIVMAISTYNGKIVKGVAKCMSSDSFDLETGKKLAAARCDLKVCEKRKKALEKKRAEIAKKLQELTHYYIRISNNYDDAIDECVKSFDRLESIKKELA